MKISMLIAFHSCRVLLASLVLLEEMDFLEDPACLDHQVQLASLGKMGTKERLVHLEKKALKETRVQWVHLDLLVLEGHQEIKVLSDLPVTKASEERWVDKEQRAKMVPLESLDQMDPLVLRVYLGLLA